MGSASLTERLSHVFQNQRLLQEALTHRSYGSPHNERLEFLGDSVLNCAIARELYRRFAKLSEGELSRLRATLVNKNTLYEVAQQLKLSEAVLLGEGELKSGGHKRPSILADALEAVFGAVLTDAGFDAAERVVLKLFAPQLDSLDPGAVAKDPKTLLQEYLQARKLSLPKYQVVEIQGEAHEQTFKVACVIAALKVRTEGLGLSRKNAEQNAAAAAYALVTHG
jgi:ribonuclease III